MVAPSLLNEQVIASIYWMGARIVIAGRVTFGLFFTLEISFKKQYTSDRRQEEQKAEGDEVRNRNKIESCDVTESWVEGRGASSTHQGKSQWDQQGLLLIQNNPSITRGLCIPQLHTELWSKRWRQHRLQYCHPCQYTRTHTHSYKTRLLRWLNILRKWKWNECS